MLRIQGGQDGEEQYVERYVQNDEQQLEGCKLDGALLLTQVGKRYALKGIDGHRHGHNPDVRRMLGIAHERGYGVKKGKHQRHKQ